jgi:hypothetical protein
MIETLEHYKVAVGDEHHYRDAVQRRIEYHTGVLVALLGAEGAGIFQAHSPLQFAVISLGGLVIFWLARHARRAIRRIYIRFLEAVEVREALEVRLGLRAGPADAQTRIEQGLPVPIATNEPNWVHPPIYRGTWLAEKAMPPHAGGYYTHTSRLFLVASHIGFVLFCVFFGATIVTAFPDLLEGLRH